MSLAFTLPLARPGAESSPRPVVTSAEWIDYFTDNAVRVREVPWESGAGVTPGEFAALAASLRGWQLGETSDGAHLLAAAKRYAAETNDPDFVVAVRLFITEEQRHGEALGRFLDLAGAGLASFDWGDFLFRSVRYFLPSMEVWATPVVMVETHALVYYNAIRLATTSPVLRTICEQILADEIPHIRFQCERLATLHRNRGPVGYAATKAFHRLLFTVVSLLIWLGHRKAYRAGGYRFGRFWRTAWAKMNHAWREMDPRKYDWRGADGE